MLTACGSTQTAGGLPPFAPHPLCSHARSMETSQPAESSWLRLQGKAAKQFWASAGPRGWRGASAWQCDELAHMGASTPL